MMSRVSSSRIALSASVLMTAVLHLLAPFCPASPGLSQHTRTTTTTYDALGRPVKVTSPVVNGVSAIMTTEYDAAGNAVRVTDALGRQSETVYDARNRPVKVTAPTVWDGVAGGFVRPATTTTYDALGQVLTVTDPMGAVTTCHYDNAGRKWKVEAPLLEAGVPRATTVTTYDAGGLALTVTNALSQTVTNTYDILGRLSSTVDAENITNSFGYDAAGNRTRVNDGKNQETLFFYDRLSRLVEQRFANGDRWTYLHNAVQKIAQTSPRGIVTSYAYDARDRLMNVSALPHGTTPALGRAYTYDNAGRLLTVTEAGNTSADVSHTYDAMGRMLSEASHGKTHFYSYDLAGNRTRVQYNNTGRVVETSYDGLNRPELIAEGGRLTRYGYDLAGRAVVLVGGNGQVSSNNYDKLGRLVDRTLFRTAAMTEAEVLAEFSWDHDALGNVLAQHETWPGDISRAQGIRSTTLGYDDNNRLTSEEVTQPEVSGATPKTTTTYTYDAANNRATKTVTRTIAGEEPISDEDTGHWSYTYNSANQLKAWEKRSAAAEPNAQKTAILDYDTAGNRTSQVVTQVVGPTVPSQTQPPAARPGTTSYRWDAQDRLLGVTMPDTSVHSYAYDYRTRRVGTSSTATGTTQQTAIVFSGGLSVAEWETTGNSAPGTANSPTVEYTRGPDMGGGVGGLLYSLRSESTPGLQSAPVAKYNLSNGRGDIVAQASQSATLTWTASYEAYGKRTKETGENKDKQRGNSKDEDPTGLLNEGFRYRDLETGVWLSRDPAGFVDGPNVYAYVRENPWSGFDPKGLDLKHLIQAWTQNDFSLQTLVGEGMGLTSIFQMPSPNDLIREGQHITHEGRRMAAMAVNEADKASKRGTTDHYFTAAAAGAGLMADHLIGTGAIGEAISGERTELNPNGKLENRQLGTFERVMKGIQGTAQVVAIVTGARGGAGEAKMIAESEGPFVYRGLAKGEDPSGGLMARAPGAGNSELSHVAGKKQSQWISTTKDEATAVGKYGEHGAVKIDLSKVTSKVSDVSDGIPNGGRMSNWAKRDKEVLVQDSIPAEAIERIK